MAATPTSSDHDGDLFATLVALARPLEPALRTATMFGCPAAFIGKRLAFCVYGAALGAKVPEAFAAELLARGAAEPFEPYGKANMRGWIALRPPFDEEFARDVLGQALACARERNGKAPPKRRT